MNNNDYLNIRMPATQTGFMSLLQTLVAHGASHWVGGQIRREKMAGLAKKFAATYPICRPIRGRTYDKQIGRAVVHLVAFAMDEMVAWVLLSTPGKGGLADPAMPDFKAAKAVMRADQHIEHGDYRLVFAKKKERREVVDKQSGKTKTIFTNTSSWTWQMTNEALAQVKAMLRDQHEHFSWGAPHHDGKPFGIRTCLAQQARRPLFSGVHGMRIWSNNMARRLACWCR